MFINLNPSGKYLKWQADLGFKIKINLKLLHNCPHVITILYLLLGDFTCIYIFCTLESIEIQCKFLYTYFKFMYMFMGLKLTETSNSLTFQYLISRRYFFKYKDFLYGHKLFFYIYCFRFITTGWMKNDI